VRRELLIAPRAPADLAALLVAVALSAALGAHALGPALTQPDAWLVGSWVHPDCLSNHWLLAWVAERVAAGESVLHNSHYYWPIGDAPVLAGNGAEGFLYLPMHLLLGWPRGVPAYVLMVLVLNGAGGWALARAAGADRWSALIMPGIVAASPFVVQELGAGRFSQADVGWLLMFLAAWLVFLRHPTTKAALAAAALLALTSFFYWYYGLFGVIAGTVLLAFRGRAAPGLRALATFAVSFVVLIGPWLWIFASHWAEIPGTDEVAAFPHPESELDAAQLVAPWTVGQGRHAGMALPWSVVGLGAVGGVFAARARRWGLLAVTVTFAMLALGPAFSGAPFTVLYGIAAPLKRFWWPIRHVVVVVAMWGVLGALALSALRVAAEGRLPGLNARWLPVGTAVTAALFAVTTPMLLDQAQAPVRVPLTPMDLPPGMASKLGALPAGVLVEPPLAPEAAGSQQHLILQRWHGKPLLSGHALWVERVRPPAWDAFVQGNSFLAEMQRLERGELGTEFTFEAHDLQVLREQGVRWFAVDRAAFPLRAKGLVAAYMDLFESLFGLPVARGKGMAAWDAAGWDGATATVTIPVWEWPAELGRGGPTLPLVARRPRNRVFEPRLRGAEAEPRETEPDL
jgi:hypothetical protein